MLDFAVRISSAGSVKWESREERPMHFVVGLKLKRKNDHLTVCAEDALIAALRAKAQRPDSIIMYVRRQNKRGDARHPSPTLAAAE
jgi:hypothetical protein